MMGEIKELPAPIRSRRWRRIVFIQTTWLKFMNAREINVVSSSDEDLLVDWLAEVIATIGTHGELYGNIEISEIGEHFAGGVLHGEMVDPARHDLRFDVKAATYHGLSVNKTTDGFRGRVIFDL